MADLIKLLVCLTFAAGLGACATSPDAALLAEEPSYQAGYGDGCATGVEEDKSFSRKRLRDEYLFENDRAYRAGWRQGFLSCGERNRGDDIDGGLILGQENEY